MEKEKAINADFLQLSEDQWQRLVMLMGTYADSGYKKGKSFIQWLLDEVDDAKR